MTTPFCVISSFKNFIVHHIQLLPWHMWFCRSGLLPTKETGSTQARQRRRLLLHLPQDPTAKIFWARMGGLHPGIDQESTGRMHSNPRVCPVGCGQRPPAASRERWRPLRGGDNWELLKLLGGNRGGSRWSSWSVEIVELSMLVQLRRLLRVCCCHARVKSKEAVIELV